MRSLYSQEMDLVFGGQLPDEDLQDMRDRNPLADNWQDVQEQAPPRRLCFESGECYYYPSTDWPGPFPG